MNKLSWISEALVLLSVLAIVGFVGGMEQERISLGAGLALCAVSAVVGIVAGAAARKAENRDA